MTLAVVSRDNKHAWEAGRIDLSGAQGWGAYPGFGANGAGPWPEHSCFISGQRGSRPQALTIRRSGARGIS